MSNAMLGFPNNIDTCTLSGGSYATTMPLARLQTRKLKDVARSSDTQKTSTFINIDQGSMRSTRALALVNHNISQPGKYRVRASNEASVTNLLAASEDFQTSNWDKANGFLQPNCVVAPNGLMTADAYTHGTTTGSYAYLSQRGAGTNDASKTWTFSMWIKVPSGTSVVSLAISNLTISTRGSGNLTVTTSWQRLSFTLLAGQLANTGSIGVGIFGTTGQVYHVWGAQLEPGSVATSYWPTPPTFVSRAGSVGTYYDNTGTMQNAAANVARMSYDPSNLTAPPYLMSEGGSTNLVLNSERFDNSSTWALTNGNITLNAGAAPNGTNTAQKFTAAVASGQHYFNAINSLALGNTTGVYSIFAKAGEESVFSFLVWGSVTFCATFDLTAKTATATGGVAYLVPLANGWFRCILITTPTFAHYMYVGLRAGQASYQGDGLSGMYFWGAQFEGATNVSSYMPTSSSTATRQADVSSFNQVRPAGYMDSWQSYDYDSGWQAVWPVVYPYGTRQWEDPNWFGGQYSLDEIKGYNATLVHALPSNMLSRYWRIEIDDTTNSAGYVQMGRVFIGPVWQPVTNIAWNDSLGWNTLTDVQVAQGGSESFDVKQPYRLQTFALNNLDPNEAMTGPFEIMRRAGIDKEVLWVKDPDDTVNALRNRFLGRLNKLNPILYPYWNLNTTGFEIKELQ